MGNPAAVKSAASEAAAAPVSGSVVPFFYGSNFYTEKFASDTVTLGTAQVELSHNITPGGFLRGFRLEVNSAGGALGGGALTGDTPYCVIASVSLENIDGGPLIYPINGWAATLRQKYTRPWLLHPSLRNNFSNTVNPAFSLYMMNEIRQTAGVLGNTDSRAQFRSKVTVNTLASLVAGGAPTAPAVTINQTLQTWAQPDATDLLDRPIEQKPAGLNLATLTRKQVVTLNAAGADNTLQLANTGNEIRCIYMVTRTAAGVRADGLTTPIRLRIDQRNLGVLSVQEMLDQMSDFYGLLLNASARETGTYVLPTFYQPGVMYGQAWRSTNNATYYIIESATAAATPAGTIEIYTDEVTPVGPIPFELESI